jgi:hypothetical protein
MLENVIWTRHATRGKKKRKNIFLIFFPRELFMKMNFSFFFFERGSIFFYMGD